MLNWLLHKTLDHDISMLWMVVYSMENPEFSVPLSAKISVAVYRRVIIWAANCFYEQTGKKVSPSKYARRVLAILRDVKKEDLASRRTLKELIVSGYFVYDLVDDTPPDLTVAG